LQLRISLGKTASANANRGLRCWRKRTLHRRQRLRDRACWRFFDSCNLRALGSRRLSDRLRRCGLGRSTRSPRSIGLAPSIRAVPTRRTHSLRLIAPDNNSDSPRCSNCSGKEESPSVLIEGVRVHAATILV
jgi:hypothetical protein